MTVDQIVFGRDLILGYGLVDFWKYKQYVDVHAFVVFSDSNLILKRWYTVVIRAVNINCQYIQSGW